jgi:hypothetical protein
MTKSIEDRLRALEDREAIANLKARYCNLNDGGWEGGTHAHIPELLDLFAEDAIWDGGPVAGRAEGKRAIATLFTAFQAVPFVFHNVMNPIIEIGGDNATGHWHAIIMATDPTRQALWTFGLYKEKYFRTPQGWKYQSIEFVPAVNAPYEEGWAKNQFFDAARKGYLSQ